MTTSFFSHLYVPLRFLFFGGQKKMTTKKRIRSLTLLTKEEEKTLNTSKRMGWKRRSQKNDPNKITDRTKRCYHNQINLPIHKKTTHRLVQTLMVFLNQPNYMSMKLESQCFCMFARSKNRSIYGFEVYEHKQRFITRFMSLPMYTTNGTQFVQWWKIKALLFRQMEF